MATPNLTASANKWKVGLIGEAASLVSKSDVTSRAVYRVRMPTPGPQVVPPFLRQSGEQRPKQIQRLTL